MSLCVSKQHTFNITNIVHNKSSKDRNIQTNAHEYCIMISPAFGVFNPISCQPRFFFTNLLPTFLAKCHVICFLDDPPDTSVYAVCLS